MLSVSSTVVTRSFFPVLLIQESFTQGSWGHFITVPRRRSTYYCSSQGSRRTLCAAASKPFCQAVTTNYDESSTEPTCVPAAMGPFDARAPATWIVYCPTATHSHQRFDRRTLPSENGFLGHGRYCFPTDVYRGLLPVRQVRQLYGVRQRSTRLDVTVHLLVLMPPLPTGNHRDSKRTLDEFLTSFLRPCLLRCAPPPRAGWSIRSTPSDDA